MTTIDKMKLGARWLGIVVSVVIAAAPGGLKAVVKPAELVLLSGRVVTEDAKHSTAEALGITAGKLVFVGSDHDARRLIGQKTRVVRAAGRLVLPGLVDAHIHPTEIVDLDVCSLESGAVTLDALVQKVATCITRYAPAPGQPLYVQQWNFAAGNQPSLTNPNLRAALDRGGGDHPVALLGNDGHHGAFNSLALARARNDAGLTVGYSRVTLHRDFADMQTLIGVGVDGEPDGTVNEEARRRMDMRDSLGVNFSRIMEAPWKVTERLNAAGITAVQDAAVTPEMLAFYNKLAKSGRLSVRVNLLQLYQPEAFRKPDGTIDYDRLIGDAERVRRRYAGDELIRAEGIKIFADGVLEGNPYATPPTLPNSPSLKPYRQPIFARNESGVLAVTGYVDLQSGVCQAARTTPPTDPIGFQQAHGFHPGQCRISSGKLEHDRTVIMDYARRAHLAGFTLHIHAIGDAAVRTAVDAIEAARAADGKASTPDTIAHLQVVSPEDIARIGKDHLYLVYTYSWMTADPEYDMTVIPFIEAVSGHEMPDWQTAQTAYQRSYYPALSTRRAGAVLAAGSDAPVGTRDPQPFVNIQTGMTRRVGGFGPANSAERLGVGDMIDAYTINGARAMGRAKDFGSLEVGKSADFIILDQDILALGEAGRGEEIGKTRVLQTWFRGKRVYLRFPSDPRSKH